ncbi:MAG: hypothetical protein ACODAU_00605 [Myxococcota bacterium]
MLEVKGGTKRPPRQVRGMGRIRGVALAETIRWYEARYGRRERYADLASLPGALRELVDPSRPLDGLIPSRWYPMELAHALLSRMQERHGAEGMREMAAEAGPDVMRAMMSGVQRTLFRLLLNPARYATHAQRVWDHNIEGGSVRVEASSPNEHVSRVDGFPGHHGFICRLLSSGLQTVYGAMGCRTVDVTLEGCVEEGSGTCATRVRWAT